MIRALIREDEHKVADALRECFAADGYHVVVEHTGESGSYRLETQVFDIVLRPAGVTQMRVAVGDLQLDRLTREVTRGGRPIALTRLEFELLDYLVSRRPDVVSRDMLARDVWNEPLRSTPLDNVIDVHMARLRRKLELPQSTPLVHTIRGVGFTVRERMPDADL
jgi:DNA-binding response OmpR family regulator